MNYPGKELEMFDKAHFWRKYLHLVIKKFIGKKILEVGAGVGSFTKIYVKENVNTTLSEIDNVNYKILKKKFDLQKKLFLVVGPLLTFHQSKHCRIEVVHLIDIFS